jgi:erythromycin esterase
MPNTNINHAQNQHRERPQRMSTTQDYQAAEQLLGRFASVDEWIAREAIPFSFDETFDTAVDRMMYALGDQVSLLGMGEPLHGGEDFLILRNRLFQRLVEAHGFSAITLEITDMRARLVNEYIAGRGPATYEDVQDSGFSYGSGLYAANRELVEWMKRYNSDPAHAVKLSFYGTLPSEQGETTESPRRALELVFTYLESVDVAAAARHREIIDPLLGADADWEGPAAAIQRELMARLMGGANAQSENLAPDAGRAFGLSPRAQALRLAVEHLAFELHMRQPELVAKSDRGSFNDALHNLSVSRNLLALHAALARRESLDTLVGMRDAMAAEHLVHIAEREDTRGKVLVHLHNAHLRRTKTKLPWYEFWPTGAHLEQLLGPRFAVIGGALGTSEANFIGAPEAGSLEARLLARQSDGFLPTWRGQRLPEGELAALPIRTGSTRPYVPYTPLFPQSVADLDGIAFLRSATYTRGAPTLPG